MAMGKRQRRQDSLFLATEDSARSPGHPFYRKLNELLAETEFDRWIKRRCQRYYEAEEKRGQPSIPPGFYFRSLLIGYFSGSRQPTRHCLAVRRQPFVGRLPGLWAGRTDARSLDLDQRPQTAAVGRHRRGISIRAEDRGRPEA
jgi:hypothetical protein